MWKREERKRCWGDTEIMEVWWDFTGSRSHLVDGWWNTLWKGILSCCMDLVGMDSPQGQGLWVRDSQRQPLAWPPRFWSPPATETERTDSNDCVHFTGGKLRHGNQDSLCSWRLFCCTDAPADFKERGSSPHLAAPGQLALLTAQAVRPAIESSPLRFSPAPEVQNQPGFRYSSTLCLWESPLVTQLGRAVGSIQPTGKKIQSLAGSRQLLLLLTDKRQSYTQKVCWLHITLLFSA